MTTVKNLAQKGKHDMKARIHSILTNAAICALLGGATLGAKAQIGGIPSKSDIVVAAIGIVAVTAAIGVGTFYAVRHNHAISGCAASGPNGLELQSKGDGTTYALVGELDGIKPGERVRVSGKKQKQRAGAPRQFLVEKLARDYGACTAP
jgi:hypothetical protein